MKYQRFEDLPVWRAAIELAVRVYELTAKPNFKGHADLKDQMERSSVSISNNIAEGFERGTTQEAHIPIHCSWIRRRTEVDALIPRALAQFQRSQI
jgi:23S rRNA-intervening sequence protein